MAAKKKTAKKRTDLSKRIGGLAGRAGGALRKRQSRIDAALGRATSKKKRK
jgi:hypothetical protein